MAKHLDTDKKYIKDLFSPESFYNVPEYQRSYVWEDEQVNAIMDDIFAAMEKNSTKEYFLGCMVWNTKKEQSYVYQDILDGQQRFLTLYLIMATIRDISQDVKMKQKINQYLKQHEDEYSNIPERQRVVFEIRDDDDFLEKYVIPDKGTVSDELPKEVSNKSKSSSYRNMARAILCIHKWWGKNTTEDDLQEKIKSFFIYLCNKVLILYLATPDNLDDAYNLFTILNSRGSKLEPCDILKAQNLRLITNDKLRKKYAEDWSSYEDFLGEPFSSFDAFLWSLVDVKMKYRSDENMTLALAFDFMNKKQIVEKGEGLFLLVEKYIQHYQSIINWKDKNVDSNNCFQNILTLLNSTSTSKFITPLMHYKECFGDYRITEYFIKLDNILSALWILGRRDSERIFSMLRKMDELVGKYKDQPDYKQLAADEFLSCEVLNYDYVHPVANTAINIEDFFDALENENWGSFTGTRVNKTKYLLLKLDILYGNKNTLVSYQHSNTSLEHVLPKTITNTEWNVLPEEHDEWCHRLGNLVLLDRKKNGSISNSVYLTKKQKYSDAIENRVYTNKLFMNYNAWTIDELAQNHKNIIALFKKYYLGNSLETLLNFHKK